jgi:hypothetical protein
MKKRRRKRRIIKKGKKETRRMKVLPKLTCLQQSPPNAKLP